MIAIEDQSSSLRARELICKEYPMKTNNKLTADYPGHQKFTAFPFDDTSIHRDILSKRKYENLENVLQQYYYHSKTPTNQGGGRFTKKLVANVNSLSELVNTKDGTTTLLREIIMDKTVTLAGVTKPMFSYIGAIPTIGNK